MVEEGESVLQQRYVDSRSYFSLCVNLLNKWTQWSMRMGGEEGGGGGWGGCTTLYSRRLFFL